MGGKATGAAITDVNLALPAFEPALAASATTGITAPILSNSNVVTGTISWDSTHHWEPSTSVPRA